MNAQDMLALARCCAAMLLNDHPLEWEDVPRAVDATEAIQTALRHVGGYHHVKATSDSPNKRPRD